MTIHTKRVINFLMCFSFLFINLYGQTSINWASLAEVTFERKQLEAEALTYNQATFSDDLKGLEGKEVNITGYIIPMDPLGITYALSKNPNASCFFCGGAGPETILQLNLKPSAIKRYNTDARLTFKGILKLNEKDIDSLTYELNAAEEL